MKSSIEKEIKTKGFVFYEVHGSSMFPLIRQNRDLAVIVNKPNVLKKYDVILYKCKEKLVLHRIIKIKDSNYIIVGDNCFQKEYNITNDSIIGILKSVERNAKTNKKQKSIKMNSAKQKFYAHIWCDLFPVRTILFKFRHIIGKSKFGLLIKNLLNKKAAD